MSVIAGVRLSDSDFALDGAFQAGPEMTLQAESIVPISSAVMPCFWVNTAATDTATRALEQSEYVDRVTVVEEKETKQLLKIEWATEPDGLVSILLDTDAIVLDAAMAENQWTFQLRFPGYEDLSAFSRRCREQNIRVQLQQLHDPTSPDDSSADRLTAEQQEVLVTAVEHGYFEVPRAVTLEELGEILGISDSAVSQRLRRGLATLLDATMLDSAVETA